MLRRGRQHMFYPTPGVMFVTLFHSRNHCRGTLRRVFAATQQDVRDIAFMFQNAAQTITSRLPLYCAIQHPFNLITRNAARV